MLTLILQPGSSKQWALVFYLTSAVLVLGCCFFDIFATAEVQPWGLVTDTDSEGAEMKLAANGDKNETLETTE